MGEIKKKKNHKLFQIKQIDLKITNCMWSNNKLKGCF
jgi:hypothetical protein